MYDRRFHRHRMGIGMPFILSRSLNLLLRLCDRAMDSIDKAIIQNL
ncbi:hypothetical protein NIES2104_13510 [Leptolyngbya sp. NIES-2104]|nr:hypothetical protein NIES2104_13510 [Leptolyngbya sp. NIES-2104]